MPKTVYLQAQLRAALPARSPEDAAQVARLLPVPREGANVYARQAPRRSARSADAPVQCVREEIRVPLSGSD